MPRGQAATHPLNYDVMPACKALSAAGSLSELGYPQCYHRFSGVRAVFELAAGPVTGGDLVSTGTAKQRGACQGAEPCESSAIANLTANDETYALAA